MESKCLFLFFSEGSGFLDVSCEKKGEVLDVFPLEFLKISVSQNELRGIFFPPAQETIKPQMPVLGPGPLVGP